MMVNHALMIRFRFYHFTNISKGCKSRVNSECLVVISVSYLYCWEPREVRGANPGMKKWRRGKGTMLTASFLRSALSWPGNLRHVVTPGTNEIETSTSKISQKLLI